MQPCIPAGMASQWGWITLEARNGTSEHYSASEIEILALFAHDRSKLGPSVRSSGVKRELHGPMRAAAVGDAHPDGRVLWPGRLEIISLPLLPAPIPPCHGLSRIQHQPPDFAAFEVIPRAATPRFLPGLAGDLHEKVIYKT